MSPLLYIIHSEKIYAYYSLWNIISILILAAETDQIYYIWSTRGRLVYGRLRSVRCSSNHVLFQIEHLKLYTMRFIYINVTIVLFTIANTHFKIHNKIFFDYIYYTEYN